jgi:hypothetical protein
MTCGFRGTYDFGLPTYDFGLPRYDFGFVLYGVWWFARYAFGFPTVFRSTYVRTSIRTCVCTHVLWFLIDEYVRIWFPRYVCFGFLIQFEVVLWFSNVLFRHLMFDSSLPRHEDIAHVLCFRCRFLVRCLVLHLPMDCQSVSANLSLHSCVWYELCTYGCTVFVRMSVCTYVCMRICRYIRAYIRTFIRTGTIVLSLCMHVGMCVHAVLCHCCLCRGLRHVRFAPLVRSWHMSGKFRTDFWNRR